MKKIFSLSSVIFFVIFTGFTFAQNLKATGSLKVIMDGFNNDKGLVKIALGNSKETYNNKETGKSFQVAEAVIKDGKAEYIFKDIPFGDYTVSVYQDENGNKKLDKNFLGIPSEKYGFSNNGGGFGAPKYENAVFILNKPEMTINITMM
jgi:uncharacterized protein (DUF2141 family)